MDSIVQAKVRLFLRETLQHQAHECGAIMFNIRECARAAGYALDERFARAGLAAGPESRIASAIVDRALGGGGGSAADKDQMRIATQRWVRTTPPMGT